MLNTLMNKIRKDESKNESKESPVPETKDDQENSIPIKNENFFDNSVKFLASLNDLTRFSYASLCAAALNVLYFGDTNEEFRHNFVTSLVAHLNLPNNVVNTMKALSDGHGSQSTHIFVESLLAEQDIKENLLLLVNDLALWAVTSSSGKYDARMRFLIRHVTWQLHVKFEDLEKVEEDLVEVLSETSEKEKLEHEDMRTKKARNKKIKRYALIGLATAGGGALIGLTGGLAAPLVAAGAGAILGGATAAALGSLAGLAIITSLFGAAGAGLTGYKMKRRVGGIDEFNFQPITISKQLATTIAVSGWLSNDNNNGFFSPWKHMFHSREQFTLVWESKHLMRLGNSLEYILNNLVSAAATEALKLTVLSGLITAVTWPASILSVAGVIDNPWSVCLQRSGQVGKELAEVLLAREHGHRPVTLIGYSLGARVIYHCLEEMARRKKHSGIIEDVYLLGAPVSGKPQDWMKFSSVVAGHITNGYCKTDWLLRFLYRTSARQTHVAGLQPVMWEDRRMVNIDLSSIITGHLDYQKKMDTVLSAVGVRTQDAVAYQQRKSKSVPLLSDIEKEPKPTSSESCPNIGVIEKQPTKLKNVPEEDSINCSVKTISSAKNNLCENKIGGHSNDLRTDIEISEIVQDLVNECVTQVST